MVIQWPFYWYIHLVSDLDIETSCTIFGLEDIVGIAAFRVDATGPYKKKVVKRKVAAKRKVATR
jgi:hypothetical protein